MTTIIKLINKCSNQKSIIGFWLLIFLFLSSIELKAACSTPFPLATSEIKAHDAILNWLDFGNVADSFTVEIVEFSNDFSNSYSISGIVETTLFIDQLIPAQNYKFRVKAHCTDEESNWSSINTFRTLIAIDQPCLFSIPLKDNNCNGQIDVFKYEENDYVGQLGVDVFINNIELVLDHTWPSDLEIQLINPAGNSVLLIANRGIGAGSFGNPEDSSCLETCQFTDLSCRDIRTASPPFIGAYKAEENISNLYDGSQSNGNWIIQICDRASGDIGKLKQFKINFYSTTNCATPANIYINSIGANTVEILNEQMSTDSLIFAIGQPEIEQSNINALQGNWRFEKFENSDTIRLNDLNANIDYQIYVAGLCNGDTTAIKCLGTFKTNCAVSTLSYGFERDSNCLAECNSTCTLLGNWTNVQTDDFDWTVTNGASATEETGPFHAFPTTGNYLLAESSSPTCQQNMQAILESDCIYISATAIDCGMAFDYMAFGRNVGQITISISLDGGTVWQNIDSFSSHAKQEWQNAQLSLSNYNNQYAQLRMTANMGDGALADLAVDNIRFYSGDLVDSLPTYYLDFDGDNFGDESQVIQYCSSIQPTNYVTQSGDCNDSASTVNPLSTEIPCNLIDENCNGLDDDQQSTNLQITPIIIQSPDCGTNDNGILTVSVTGATDLTFKWNNNSTDSIITDLMPGNYQVTITQSGGCKQASSLIELESQVDINIGLSQLQNSNCQDLNSGLIVLQTNLINPTVNWNSGDTGLAINQLAHGFYQATVSDGNCVMVSDSFEIEIEGNIQLAFIDINEPKCSAESNGNIFVSLSGGTMPYSYLWSNGDTTRFLENVTAGQYQLTAKDAIGCEFMSDTFVIENKTPLEYSITTFDPATCYGDNNGQIQINISGGTIPYSSFWDNGTTVIISNDLLNISGGSYDLTIVDGNNCTITSDDIVLPSPGEMDVLLDSIRDVSCGIHTDGYIATTVINGQGALRYFWDDSSVDTSDRSDLSVNEYAYVAIDEQNCKVSSPLISIQNSDQQLQAIVELLDTLRCPGDMDASAFVEIFNGNAPYKLAWEDFTEQTIFTSTYVQNGLSAGTYKLIISDRFFCESEELSVSSIAPDTLKISEVELVDPICKNALDGVVKVLIENGKLPIDYNWSNGEFDTDSIVVGAGNYEVTISDANGCTFISPSYELINPDTFYYSSTVNQISGNPNPKWRVQVNPQFGEAPYSIIWPGIDSSGQAFILDVNTVGYYSFILTDANGCSIIDSIDVGNVATENTQSFKGKVWPNPVLDRVYIEAEYRIEELTLFTENGMHLLTKRDLNNKNTSLDLSQFSAGVYLIKIQTKSVETWHKIVKLK